MLGRNDLGSKTHRVWVVLTAAGVPSDTLTVRAMEEEALGESRAAWSGRAMVRPGVRTGERTGVL